MRADERTLKGVLFSAHNQGYTSDKKPEILMVNDVRMKRFRYASLCGRFVVEDTWHSTGGMHSAGSTLIIEDGQPAWIMQRYGWYRPEASGFLKRALGANYRKRTFHGGRGPAVFTVGSLRYINAPENGSTFSRFSGREGVLQRGSYAMGEHFYQGGTLYDD